MNKKTNSGLKIICLNRKASFNYFFEDILEAGIVLKGSEIKSVRDGKVNIADSYAVEKDGEIILVNAHISTYKNASYSNHKPTDERKLLLNKKGQPHNPLINSGAIMTTSTKLGGLMSPNLILKP